MAEVQDTQGTQLRRNGTVVPKVRSIGPVGIGRGLRDVTTLSDTTHVHKKNLADIPEIAVELFYDPEEAIHQVIMQDDALATLLPWQIYAEQGNSPGEVWEFSSCYVVNAEIQNMEVDGDMVLSFSLKPQALPVGLFEGVIGSLP